MRRPTFALAVLLALAGCASGPDRAAAKAGLEQLKAKGRIDDISPTNFVYCAQMNDLQAIQLYLDSGLEVNAANSLGRTALMGAAAGDNQSPWYEDGGPVLQLLLQRGARVDLRDRDGNTALKMARELNRPKTIQLLEAAGAKE